MPSHIVQTFHTRGSKCFTVETGEVSEEDYYWSLLYDTVGSQEQYAEFGEEAQVPFVGLGKDIH